MKLGARLARLERATPSVGCEGCRGQIQTLTLAWDEPAPPLATPCRCMPARIVRIIVHQPRPWDAAPGE
jgi:hypothetical protein